MAGILSVVVRWSKLRYFNRLEFFDETRFGGRYRGRQTTSSFCLSSKFSAMMPFAPPGPSSFAAAVTRWIKQPDILRGAEGQQNCCQLQDYVCNRVSEIISSWTCMGYSVPVIGHYHQSRFPNSHAQNEHIKLHILNDLHIEFENFAPDALNPDFRPDLVVDI